MACGLVCGSARHFFISYIRHIDLENAVCLVAVRHIMVLDIVRSDWMRWKAGRNKD